LRENGDFMSEMQDVFCALAWAHTNASTYGVDTTTLVAVGGSRMGGTVRLLAMVDDATP